MKALLYTCDDRLALYEIPLALTQIRLPRLTTGYSRIEETPTSAILPAERVFCRTAASGDLAVYEEVP